MLVGHTLKNRYRIYDRLGMGGAATVYLARDSDTGQMVIVKVVHPHLVNEQFIGRFQREIDILEKLDNDHVIRLFAWGLREFDEKLNESRPSSSRASPWPISSTRAARWMKPPRWQLRGRWRWGWPTSTNSRSSTAM